MHDCTSIDILDCNAKGTSCSNDFSHVGSLHQHNIFSRMIALVPHIFMPNFYTVEDVYRGKGSYISGFLESLPTL